MKVYEAGGLMQLMIVYMAGQQLVAIVNLTAELHVSMNTTGF